MQNLNKEEIYKLENKFISKPQEFRKEFCYRCVNKTIIEIYYDEKAAYDYLESINDQYPPRGVSQQAHIYGAELIAAKRGDNKNFHRVKVYECPHKYCKGIDNALDFAVQDIVETI